MVVVVEEVFRQFESSELVAGRDSTKDSRSVEIRKMSIGRTPRDLGHPRFDVRDAERMIGGGQQFHHGSATGGVALVDPAKQYLNKFVEVFH